MNNAQTVPHLLQDISNLRFDNAVAAIIVIDDGRYLVQLRDDKAGIFYPNHYGLFGGAVEPGEDPVDALRRELHEELDLKPTSIRYFTRLDFDFTPVHYGHCYRIFFAVPLDRKKLGALTLGEGRRMEALPIQQLLLSERMVPYDSFAVWMHYQVGNTGKISKA